MIKAALLQACSLAMLSSGNYSYAPFGSLVFIYGLFRNDIDALVFVRVVCILGTRQFYGCKGVHHFGTSRYPKDSFR